MAARLSAATFVAVAPDRDESERWAERVVGTVSDPISFDEVTVHPSFGAVLVTSDGTHRGPGALLDDAEFAARRTMRHGRDRVGHVALTDRSGGRGAIGIAAQVQRAVASGQIEAVYQPVIDLRSMQPVGVEALARWRGAPTGYGSPEDFLPIVDALGLLPQVFDTMLATACRDVASGPAADRGWWVSVNLAEADCVDPTLPGRVGRILAETGLDPSRLVLEVSERCIPVPEVERALRNLGGLGITLAIDDFGSGWSSLAQLRSLPIALLKIDRSLVSDPTTADAHLAMVAIALAGALGLEAIAEGVETGEDALMLCLAECDYGQGFWWSEAEPLDTILERFPAVASDSGDAYAEVFDLASVSDLADRSEDGPGRRGRPER